MLAVPLVTAVYFMMNVAYMTVLTTPEMIAAPAVAVVTITQYFNLICYTNENSALSLEILLISIYFLKHYMKPNFPFLLFYIQMLLNFCHKMAVKIIHNLLI